MAVLHSHFARWRDPIFLAKIRIGSGLVLFFYALTHFLNHALGLWSLEVQDDVGSYFRLLWRFFPFTVLLYGAFLTHIIFVLHHLHNRQSLKMSVREWLQILLGLSIPFLMIVHLLATRMAHDIYGINDGYAYVVLASFVQSPATGWINTVGLLAVWLHGCVGIHAWLRLKPWYRGDVPAILLAMATIVPVLALTGFMAAGREVAILAQDGEWLGEFFQQLNLPEENLAAIIYARARDIRYAFAALLIGLLIWRLVRYWTAERDKKVEINYLDGPVIHHATGASLLDISRINNVPHASVCGGRGRCSTCRVRIISAKPSPAPAGEEEQKVLDRIGSASDVRLACQLIPEGKMKVIRLLPADATMRTVGALTKQSSGVEQIVAVMFADIRGFTARSEAKLPFDVVYLVNQFSSAMGGAIEKSGGKVDKFLGDGVMALFGTDSSPQEGCIAALKAAAEMLQALDTLNDKLSGDLDEPLKIGIGIHAGPVVLGEMGYGASRGLTAIGDTVNTASRLEAATKEQGVALCISASVAELSKMTLDKTTEHAIVLRGKKHKLPIHAVNRDALLALE